LRGNVRGEILRIEGGGEMWLRNVAENSLIARRRRLVTAATGRKTTARVTTLKTPTRTD
jgi:hypothetical protein